MKKLTIFLAACLTTYYSYAQNTFPPSGNVGIGSLTNELLTLRDASIAFDAPSGIFKLRFDSGGGGGGIGFEKETFNTGGLRFFTQYGYNTTVERMRLTSNGNVGIGVTAPSAKLHILNAFDGSNTKALSLFYQGSWGTAAYASAFRFLDISSTEGGNILQANGYGIGIGYAPPAYNSSDKLYINGNVGIGTATPDAKLAVNGTIHSKEVKVDLSVPGPDYVFEPTYNLPKLNELKAYVEKHHHLPEIPSADQMVKNGVDLGDMNIKILKKVEELTLYLIEKDKQIAEQQRINNEQQKNNERDNVRIAALEKALIKLNTNK
jgi:hypothetical protein